MNEQLRALRTIERDIVIPSADPQLGPVKRPVLFARDLEGNWQSIAPVAIARIGAGRTDYSRRIVLADRSENPTFDPATDLVQQINLGHGSSEAHLVNWHDESGRLGKPNTAARAFHRSTDQGVFGLPTAVPTAPATARPPEPPAPAPRAARPAAPPAPPVRPTVTVGSGWGAAVDARFAAELGARRQTILSPALSARLAGRARSLASGDVSREELAYRDGVRRLFEETKASVAATIAEGGDPTLVLVESGVTPPENPVVMVASPAANYLVTWSEYVAQR